MFVFNTRDFMENQRSRDGQKKKLFRFKEVLNGVMAFKADGDNFGHFTANNLLPSFVIKKKKKEKEKFSWQFLLILSQCKCLLAVSISDLPLSASLCCRRRIYSFIQYPVSVTVYNNIFFAEK